MTAAPRGAEVTPGKGAGGPVELVLGHFVPTRHEFHARLLEPWAREVEGRSGGRLRIVIHPGGSLGPAPAQYQNVTAGAMDIGLGVHSYTPGRFPLTESLELPFLWDSAGRATQALQALYRGVPALRREYADARVLALWANGPAQVMTTKKPVRGLDDLKGLKLRSPGRLHNRTIEALGGVPLSTAITEVYDALERGIAHGAINAPSTFSSFNLTEVIRHTALADVTVATFFLVMNKERWEALPGEAQALLDDLSGEALALRAAQVSDET
jgi:TRAP-type transport system periplasmic protein